MGYAKRIPGIDGLRGIAAIAVMFYHFNIFFLPQARLSDFVPFLSRAYLAVDLFFMLSGYVMAHVYGRGLASNWRAYWRTFAIARFARIYPLFALTTVSMMTVVALSAIRITSVSFDGRSLVLQPLLLQQWNTGLNWNYPSWSISTEAEAYFAFVFLAGPLLTGKHPRPMAAGCIATLAGMSIASKAGSLNHYHGLAALLRTLAEFSLGVLLYRAHSGDGGFRGKRALILTILLSGLSIVTSLDFLVVGAFAFLLRYAVNATNTFGRLLNSRVPIALGTWSYSIYLWHVPVHFAVMAAFAARGNPVSKLSLPGARLLSFATMLAVIGISALNCRYFETPARNLLRALPGWQVRSGTGNGSPHRQQGVSESASGGWRGK